MNAPDRKFLQFVSLRVKFLVGFTLLFSLVFAVAFYWFYSFATEMALGKIEEDMVNTLYGGIEGIEGDVFAAMAHEAEPREDGLTDDPRYWEHRAWLDTIHQLEPRAYPYSWIRGDEEVENQVLFIGDFLLTVGWDKASVFREPYITQGSMVKGLSGLWKDLEPYEDKWGNWISAYAPIRNDAGESVGGLGIDFRADYVREVQRSILDTVFVAFLITYAALFILVFIVSQTLTRPIIGLTQIVERVAEGDYDQDMSALYSGRLRDEVATLARVFEMMVHKVREREEGLKRQVEELRIEIDHSKKARQVAEITESEYFQELKERAEELRKRAAAE